MEAMMSSLPSASVAAATAPVTSVRWQRMAVIVTTLVMLLLTYSHQSNAQLGSAEVTIHPEASLIRPLTQMESFGPATSAPSKSLPWHWIRRGSLNDGSVVGMIPFDLRVEYRLADPSRTLDPPLGIDTPHPRFSWKLSEMFNERGHFQTAYQLQVYERHSNALLWDTDRTLSGQTLHVKYAGLDLQSDTHYVFQVRYWDQQKRQSEWAQGVFHTGLLHPHNFLNVSWIGHSTMLMNELRREFTVGSEIIQATAFVSGIGYYSFELNGAVVDATRRLDPGWTPYEKRVLYSTYDVTDQLRVGGNCIGIQLGNGWFTPDQYLWPAQSPAGYGGVRLWFSMNITTKLNGSMHIVSDGHWRGRQGSITWDSVYGGEHRDARLDRDGWSTFGFVDKLSLWAAPEIVPAPGGALTSQMMEPIRVVAQLKPVKVWQPSSALNTFVVDFGQNFAGWVRVKVGGARGRSVHIKYAEILEQASPAPGGLYNGDFPYFDNLRGAAQTDVYVFKGVPGGEWYEPQFTVHGFRYVMIQDTSAPSADTIVGMVVATAAPTASSFSSNNPIINQINHNVIWGQQSNLMSIPSDCPQRDERKGWMGDASLSVDEALYNFKLGGFYTNFLKLIRDEQGPKGEVPDTVPLSFGQQQGDPSWGRAYGDIVWNMYLHNGDRDIVVEHYPNIKKWVDFLISQAAASGLVNMYTWYGDWVPPEPAAMCNGHLVASVSVLHAIDQFSRMAKLVGNSHDQKTYSDVYTRLAKEFHATFYSNTTHGYADGYQTCNVLPLSLDPPVVPANLRQSILQAVINDIVAHNNHLTTGIIGTKAILEVLSDNDRNDMSLVLATQTTYPSWGYMITNPTEPATTLWELWNAPMKGPEMNSRNHIMYGSIGGWFHRTLAGISPNGFDPIIIRPRMSINSGVTYVKDTYQSYMGDISVRWQFGHVGDEGRHHYGRIHDDTKTGVFQLEVTLPPNARALVHLPTTNEFGRRWSSVLESGSAICSRRNIRASAEEFGSLCNINSIEGIQRMELDTSDDHVIMHVISGSYSFVLA